MTESKAIMLTNLAWFGLIVATQVLAYLVAARWRNKFKNELEEKQSVKRELVLLQKSFHGNRDAAREKIEQLSNLLVAKDEQIAELLAKRVNLPPTYAYVSLNTGMEIFISHSSINEAIAEFQAVAKESFNPYAVYPVASFNSDYVNLICSNISIANKEISAIDLSAGGLI